MKPINYILVALGQFVFILAILILVRLLFSGIYNIEWRDIVLSAIFTGVFLFQTQRAKRKQEKIDKRVEENREKQSW